MRSFLQFIETQLYYEAGPMDALPGGGPDPAGVDPAAAPGGGMPPDMGGGLPGGGAAPIPGGGGMPPMPGGGGMGDMEGMGGPTPSAAGATPPKKLGNKDVWDILSELLEDKPGSKHD